MSENIKSRVGIVQEAIEAYLQGITEIVIPVSGILEIIKKKEDVDLSYQSVIYFASEVLKLSIEEMDEGYGIRILLDPYLNTNQRAVKLLAKKKKHIVVAVDEPYFSDVYELIKAQEVKIGRWTDDDEQSMKELLSLNKQLQ